MTSLREGLQRVVRRPAPVLAIALLKLALVWLAARPFSAVLAPLLDDRAEIATRALNGDDALVAELLSDHPGLLGAPAISLLAFAALWLLISWIAQGGLLTYYRDSHDRSGDSFAVDCARHAPRMIAVGALGSLFHLILLGLVVGGSALTWKHWAHRGFFSFAVGVALSFVIGMKFWALSTVVTDVARGLALDSPTRRAHRVFIDAFKLIFDAELSKTSWLIVGFMAAHAIATATYHGIAYAIGDDTLLGGTVLGLLRIALSVARVAITTATLIGATASRLESVSDRETLDSALQSQPT